MTASVYDTEHAKANYPPGIDGHWWHLARNQIITRALAKHIQPTTRILDVGCGPGVAVRHLLSQGYDAWGAEPAEMGITHANVLKSFAEDLPQMFRASVDCLTLLDVIEHIEDPGKFLTNLVLKFDNAKTVLIAVPARPEAWSNYDEYYGHHRRYTPASLHGELRGAGLIPVRTFYFFHSLYVAAMAINLLRRPRETVVPQPGNAILHSIIAAGIVAENAVLGHVCRGLSLLCVARR